MRFVFLLFALLFTTHICSQTITGNITDAQSGKPVASAHIYDTKTGLGTISNREGAFSLKLPQAKGAISIRISHIAYASKVVEVSTAVPLEVRLEPDFTSLDEVVVTNSAGDMAKEIFRQLVAVGDQIRFGSGFYRQVSMKDTLPTEWVESFMDLAYSSQGLREIHIEQARVAETRPRDKDDFHLSSSNFTYFSFMPVFQSNLSPLATPFSPHYFDDYNFYIEEEYKKGVDTVVKLGFNPTDELEAPIETYGWLLYNLSEKKLLQMSVSMDSDLGLQEGFQSQGLAMKIHKAKHNLFYEFSNHEQNVIELISVSFTGDLEYNSNLSAVSAHSTLLIYEADTKKHRKLTVPKLDTNFFEKFRKARYRPRFWQDNPVIMRTVEEERIIRTLEAAGAFGTYFKGKK